LLLWPSGQSAFYDPPIRTGPDAVVITALIVILIMVFLGRWLYGRNRRLFFCFAVYLAGLLPVAQIVPLVTLMNDRYLYFPMLGIAPVAGAAAVYLAGPENGGRRTIAYTIIGGLLLVIMAVSWSRTKVWQNSRTLWADAVAKSPGSDTAWTGLGDANRSARDLEGAVTAYLRALAINPEHEKALHGIGYVYLQLGKPLDARPYLKKTTELFPRLASGFEHLGHSYYMTNEYAAAESAYKKARALNPRSANTLLYLGNIALGAGQLDQAENFLNQALRYEGPAGDIEYGLACLYAKKREPDAALVHLKRALAGGFGNIGLINSNPELAAVRKSPVFARLISEYEKLKRSPEQNTRSRK
jgi:tetratricopeptide (TPR) repeat protein